MVVENIHVFSLAKAGVCEQDREELVLTLQHPSRDVHLVCLHFDKVFLHLEVQSRIKTGVMKW